MKNKITDTLKISVLKYDDVNLKFFFGEDVIATDLVPEDFEIIEVILNTCIEKYNKSIESEASRAKYKMPVDYRLINLSDYKRQYVCAKNKNGEKVVWVNCFCNAFNTNWRKDLVMVDDGGKCYFNLIINLSKKTYYSFMVNGES